MLAVVGESGEGCYGDVHQPRDILRAQTPRRRQAGDSPAHPESVGAGCEATGRPAANTVLPARSETGWKNTLFTKLNKLLNYVLYTASVR